MIIIVVFVVTYIIYKLVSGKTSVTTLAQTERYYEESLFNQNNVGKIVLYTNGSSTLNPIVGYTVSPSISSMTSKTFSPTSSFKIENLSSTFNPNFQVLAAWTIGAWKKPVEESITKLWFPYASAIQYDPKMKTLSFSGFTTANMGSTLTNFPIGTHPILTLYIAWY